MADSYFPESGFQSVEWFGLVILAAVAAVGVSSVVSLALYLIARF